jgi:hypothetical protein
MMVVRDQEGGRSPRRTIGLLLLESIFVQQMRVPPQEG